MASDTLILQDGAELGAVKAAVSRLRLPAGTEVLVEPAHDYPGQELAVDVYAPTEDDLAEALRILRRTLAPQMLLQLASDVDRQTMAAQGRGFWPLRGKIVPE